MKIRLFFIALIVSACAAEVNPDKSNSALDEAETVVSINTKSLFLNNSNDYLIAIDAFKDDGIDFKVLLKEQLRHKLDSTPIPNEINTLLSSLKDFTSTGAIVHSEEGPEAIGTLISINPIFPSNILIEEYIAGFDWLPIDERYYENSREFGLWGRWIEGGDPMNTETEGRIRSYEINFSKAELEYLKGKSIDSIGFDSVKYKHPSDFNLSGDTPDYYFKNFKNRKIPVKSKWSQTTLYWNGSLYSSHNMFDKLFVVLLNQMNDTDLKNFNLDSTLNSVKMDFIETEEGKQDVVRYLGKSLAFNLIEVKQLDKMLGTSYFKSWDRWKNPPKKNPPNSDNPCEGYKDCSFEVRQKMEGAGWELVGDVIYYGEGVHYAVGAKPMETGVKQIYYTMDCNCEPLKVRFE
jgi:hypothetical protein